ncbi:MAG: glucose 1-dehydrogenase [Planctomycetales bacterium]|nr:glucose 1-dehydrogenase [Planctomycetales bacterium]
MEISLRNKIAIVTGSASGIGFATTRQFLASGIEGVTVVDDSPDLASAMATLRSEGGERIEIVAGDVSQASTHERMVEATLARFGRIDVLLNNAAVSVVKAVHDHSPEEWDRVMDVNVKAVYLAAQLAIPVMIRQRTGVVLNTGSISGLVGIANQGAYAASKGALHQMTRQMAVEYAPYGIRVNAVALGTVDTQIVHRSAEQSPNPHSFLEDLRAAHPLGRIATAAEAAKFFTFLASDDAAFFTGAVLSLDGGYTAQ